MLTYSLKNETVALVVQLMNEINEAQSLAYRASLVSDQRTVDLHDASIARKLARAEALGYPLHVARPCYCRDSGRQLTPYHPNGWSYIVA